MKKLLFLIALLFASPAFADSNAALPAASSVSISGSSTVIQSTHDDLNANVNLQVGDTDVSGGNPVPVSGTISTSGDTTVVQPTHDQLQGNMNIQISDVDVGALNPVPISDNGFSLTVDGTVGAAQSGTWTLDSITNVVSVDDNASTLSVDDGAGSLTVDGTVNAAQSGTWTVDSITNTVSVDDDGSSLTVDGTLTVGSITITGDSTVIQPTHDNLNANVNLQVGDVDVSGGNPVPVSGTLTASGDTTVIQPTHDNLQANVNIQIADTDVGAGNPVPISDNAGSLTVDGTVAATQSGTWNVGTLTSITNVVSVDDNAGSLTVDGTVAATQSGAWTASVTQTTHDSLNANTNMQIGDVDVGGANPVPISDNSTSITVDGTVDIATITNDVPITDNGNVISVDDAAGSLTVDGTVAATQSGTWNIGTLTTVTNDVNVADGGNILSVDDAGVTLSVDDGAGSLTVDGTVAATQSGTWNIGTLTSVTNDVNIADGGNSITVDQATHDNLQANATIQVADTDVSSTNPVPSIQTLLASSTYAPTVDTNLGASAAKSIKGSAGNVVSITAHTTGTDRYFLLHNKATAPISTDTPVATFKIPANGQVVIGNDFFTSAGMHFATGIGTCYSSTINTCTPAALNGGEHFIVNYK